jgi:hypothetical protein
VAAAAKAKQLSTNATDLEKLYIAAAAARRDLSQRDPNVGYVKALRALLAKYPTEIEARTYLALHIMSGFELPSKRPRPGSMEAVGDSPRRDQGFVGSSGRAPLRDSRMGRLDLRQGSVAELPALWRPRQ